MTEPLDQLVARVLSDHLTAQRRRRRRVAVIMFLVGLYVALMVQAGWAWGNGAGVRAAGLCLLAVPFGGVAVVLWVRLEVRR